PADKGYIGALEITPDCFERLDQFKRTLAGRTGCGLCGVDRLDHAIRPLNKIKSQLRLNPEVVYNSMKQLSELQVQNKKTGALHAAAFVAVDGEILCVREDIGRHNALDKLIGHMMRHKINPANGFALITSRCSFEMVHKCATFGIPVLAAVSATTDLALKLAEDSGLSLIAFTRRDGMNIYADPDSRLR
ncbi:MAG TPA: formate dehydrogenase accessory sulfurtransferase FdhD, partial [Sphingomonadales bacterium]|nr:formate dehydrogenase accessory sulfurtransferase FdhD [Sphingomonadales bacterium]